MTAADWQHARVCCAWVLAYLDALRAGRALCPLKPDYWRQNSLFEG